MLLGVYGVFAVGKSTFFQNHMDELADVVEPEMTIVLADYKQEYWLDKRKNRWDLREHKPRWKGSREDKLPWIEPMIGDKKRLWIVESARYFGGLQDYLVACHRKHYGGLRFIITITDPETARKFLVDRCEKRNKEFQASYWDNKRLMYESYGRYVNVVNSAYNPAGVPCLIRNISEDRHEWIGIQREIEQIISLPVRSWYKDEISANQRQQRIR